MKKLKIQIGIYALSMMTMASLVVSPIIGLITRAFQNNSVSSVQMIISISNLTGLVSAFIVGKLAITIAKRTLALWGTAGVFVFGLAPYFIHNSVLELIIFSGLVGFAIGFVTNVIPALIADYFDDNERQTVMGRYVAASSIGAMIMLYISGALGVRNFQSGYLAYLFAGLVFIIAMICLPKIDTTVNQVRNKSQNSPKVSIIKMFNVRVVSLMCVAIAFMIINNIWNNNYALFLSQAKLGNSNTAGIVSTIFQLGGLVSGLLMGKMAKFARNYLLGGAFVLSGLSLLLLAYAPNIAVAIVAAFVNGYSMSMYFAQGPFLMTLLVPGVLIPMGSALLNAAGAIGGFAEPILINKINEAIWGSMAQGTLLIGAIASLIIAIILYVSKFQKKCFSVQEKGQK